MAKGVQKKGRWGGRENNGETVHWHKRRIMSVTGEHKKEKGMNKTPGKRTGVGDASGGGVGGNSCNSWSTAKGSEIGVLGGEKQRSRGPRGGGRMLGGDSVRLTRRNWTLLFLFAGKKNWPEGGKTGPVWPEQ